MSIIIKEVTKDSLYDYLKIPMIKKVSSVYQLNEINNGLGGIIFKEVNVKPYEIDMSLEEKPLEWEAKFNISKWGFFIAYENEIPIAGFTLVYDTDGVNMLRNRKDITVLWDIRIAQKYQRKGIGTELFNQALLWSKERNCKQMKIETQNNNVRACKFYAKMGCVLGEVNKYAYFGDDQDEVQLIWYKDLN